MADDKISAAEVATSIPHASGTATEKLAPDAPVTTDKSFTNNADVNTTVADTDVAGKIAIAEVAEPDHGLKSSFDEVHPITDHNVQPPVELVVVADDISKASRDPKTEAKATKINQDLADTEIAMSHPDGATSDGYKAGKKKGTIMVPAGEAEALKAHGFEVVDDG
jgi:hypothetical protein